MKRHSFPAKRARQVPGMLAACALFLAGCLDLDPAEDLKVPEPESAYGAISIGATADQESFAGLARSARVEVEATGMEGMQAELSVNASGAEGIIEEVPAGKQRSVSVTVFDASGTAVFRGLTEVDVEAGSTVPASLDLSPIPGPSIDDSIYLSEKSLTAGAQSNPTLGSFIDLDDYSAHLLSDVRNRAADIDLFFGFSTSISSAAIYSPHTAKNGSGGSSGFNLLAAFNPALNTELKTASEFDSIRTQSQIDSLWAAATVSTNGRIPLVAGSVFMAKSNLGLIVLIKVETVDQNALGSAVLHGKAKF